MSASIIMGGATLANVPGLPYSFLNWLQPPPSVYGRVLSHELPYNCVSVAP